VRYAPYDRTLRVTVDAARNKTTVRSAAFMRDIVRSLGAHLFWRWHPEEKAWTTDVALNDAEVAALRVAAAADALPFALRRVRADGREEEDVASHDAASALETEARGGAGGVAAAAPAPPICRQHGRPCVLRTAGERAMPHNRGRRFWTCPQSWSSPDPSACTWVWEDGTLPFSKESQARYNAWADKYDYHDPFTIMFCGCDGCCGCDAYDPYEAED
jgi:hypothetical protein